MSVEEALVSFYYYVQLARRGLVSLLRFDVCLLFLVMVGMVLFIVVVFMVLFVWRCKDKKV